MNFLEQIDFQILDCIQLYIRSPFLDSAMSFITKLGNIGALWIILTILFLILKKYKKDGLALAAALILGAIFCNLLLKNIVCRPRPFNINTAIELIIPPPHDYSFPSGHTCASFSSAMVLLKTAAKRISIPAVIAAVLISFSRMYLYVHFPSDVIAGVVIGILCGIAAVKIISDIDSLKKYKFSRQQNK